MNFRQDASVRQEKEIMAYYDNLINLSQHIEEMIVILGQYYKSSVKMLLANEYPNKPLRDITSVPSRKKDAIGYTLPVSYIPTDGVKNGKMTRRELTTRSESDKCKLAKTGDIIICRIKDSLQIGRYATIDFAHNGYALVSSEFFVLEPKSEVRSEWIRFFLDQDEVLSSICENSYGCGIQRINNEYLLSLKIPCPSIEEQDTILNDTSIKSQKYHFKKIHLISILEKLNYLIDNYYDLLAAKISLNELTPIDEIERISTTLLEI